MASGSGGTGHSERADSWGAGSPEPDQMPVVPRTSGLAIASLVCGILAFLCVGPCASLPGLILGIIALSAVAASRGGLTGRGLAIAGTALSVLNLLLFTLIVSAILLPALGAARRQAREVSCQVNLRQLGLSVMMYANDNKDNLPDASQWCDSLQGYTGDGKVFRCLAAPLSKCGYAFNKNLSGVSMPNIKVPGNTVLLFESDAGWNASGDQGAMIARPRHPGGFIILFADGHVETVPRERLPKLIWNPGQSESHGEPL